jgi:hypothetical protein
VIEKVMVVEVTESIVHPEAIDPLVRVPAFR